MGVEASTDPSRVFRSGRTERMLAAKLNKSIVSSADTPLFSQNTYKQVAYLSTRLSHQHGTLISVMPLFRARSCFSLSLLITSESVLSAIAISLT